MKLVRTLQNNTPLTHKGYFRRAPHLLSLLLATALYIDENGTPGKRLDSTGVWICQQHEDGTIACDIIKQSAPPDLKSERKEP
jgi:hypothetical protein